MSRHVLLGALVMGAALVMPAVAEAQDIAGNWTASYPARVRNTNGAESSDMGTAIFTVEQKGDSIFGTWHAQNTPRPAEPRTFRGTFKDGKLNFVGSPIEARVRRGDGDDTAVQMITYFEGTLKDGVIEGTMYSESTDTMIKTSPAKWSAKKAIEK